MILLDPVFITITNNNQSSRNLLFTYIVQAQFRPFTVPRAHSEEMKHHGRFLKTSSHFLLIVISKLPYLSLLGYLLSSVTQSLQPVGKYLQTVTLSRSLPILFLLPEQRFQPGQVCPLGDTWSCLKKVFHCQEGTICHIWNAHVGGLLSTCHEQESTIKNYSIQALCVQRWKNPETEMETASVTQSWLLKTFISLSAGKLS